MRGFTLIETILYIALFGMLMTGTLLGVYRLLQSASIHNTKTVVQNEGNFVLRKIDWALNGVQSVSTPTAGVPYSATLALSRYDGTSVRVRQTGSVIELSTDGGTTYAALTTSNVTVSQLQFRYIAGTPSGVEASTTISGVMFSTTKYLR